MRETETKRGENRQTHRARLRIREGESERQANRERKRKTERERERSQTLALLLCPLSSLRLISSSFPECRPLQPRFIRLGPALLSPDSHTDADHPHAPDSTFFNVIMQEISAFQHVKSSSGARNNSKWKLAGLAGWG